MTCKTADVLIPIQVNELINWDIIQSTQSEPNQVNWEEGKGSEHTVHLIYFLPFQFTTRCFRL